MSSPPLPLLLLLLVAALLASQQQQLVLAAQWCIARSAATDQALQSALDYACGVGAADCQPIQQSGLCFLPNTLPAHASYAFNSFFQRSRAAPGACDFAGTATITITDPGYGSCTFPSSASTAGGTTAPTTPGTSPSTNTNSPNPTTTNSPGASNGNAGVGGLTPIGGLTPANGLTPNTGGVSSGFGTQVPTDSDYSGSDATLLPLMLFAYCHILLLLL